MLRTHRRNMSAEQDVPPQDTPQRRWMPHGHREVRIPAAADGTQDSPSGSVSCCSRHHGRALSAATGCSKRESNATTAAPAEHFLRAARLPAASSLAGRSARSGTAMAPAPVCRRSAAMARSSRSGRRVTTAVPTGRLVTEGRRAGRRAKAGGSVPSRATRVIRHLQRVRGHPAVLADTGKPGVTHADLRTADHPPCCDG
jgi:hypothetical protein